jgi:hypothetical protein
MKSPISAKNAVYVCFAVKIKEQFKEAGFNL